MKLSDTVTLDGSGSTAPAGNSYSYNWTLTSKLNGSQAFLVNPTSIKPEFESDKGGVYTISLTVSVGSAESKVGTVTVTVESTDYCLTDTICAMNYFCRKADGACSGSGSCTIKPELCTEQYDPVCGCDGNTYGNTCKVRQTGINVSYQGVCTGMPPVANTGNDLVVTAGDNVTLDDSGSSDPDSTD